MAPTDAQINKLFAQLKDVLNKLSEVESSFESAKAAINLAVSNSELFVSGYYEHGAEIAALKVKVDKIMASCPNIRPPTDEFSKVNDPVEE